MSHYILICIDISTGCVYVATWRATTVDGDTTTSLIIDVFVNIRQRTGTLHTVVMVSRASDVWFTVQESVRNMA